MSNPRYRGPNGHPQTLGEFVRLDWSIRWSCHRCNLTDVRKADKQSLIQAPPPLQRRYVQGLVSQIVVDKEKAIISGPKAAIAAAVTAGAYQPEVRSFVREWHTRQDSN